MTGSCLEALASMSPSTQALVIDNASTDRTVELARQREGACVTANAENRGFAAAVNQGVRISDADLVLLLNPDARLLTPLDDLAEAARRYGLAGGRLVDEKGRDQRGFTIRRFPTPATLLFELFGLNRLWPQNPVNRSYRYLDRDLNAGGPVEQPAGAFLMFRRDVWERLGGFDESFRPIWFEDVDFCRRAALAGCRIEYVPSAVAEHQGGHSVGRLPPARRGVYWCDSLLRYASRHFGPGRYRAICLAVVLTSVPRMVAGMIRERNLSPVSSCKEIIRFAGRRLVCWSRAAPPSQD
ncbi:MAG TPA: glycosyltransferase family 2 protein [Bryobacteraceae bacterium]